MTKFLCDGVTEAWIDFAYEGHSFTINDQPGAYWFFVADPACPEALLRVVLDHFDQLSSSATRVNERGRLGREGRLSPWRCRPGERLSS